MQSLKRFESKSKVTPSYTMVKKSRENAPTRVISFTSGKGGVGKSNTVVNTAIALADMGRRVLILDADLSLANVDLLFGVTPKGTIHDVVAGTTSLREIVIETKEGVSIIPASSGVESLTRLTGSDKLLLLNEIESLGAQYDYLLVDTGAGISSEVMYFNAASSETICIINGEPTSLTDAYALIKVLVQSYGEKRVSVLANNVSSEGEGRKAFERLSKVVQRFLQVQLVYMGAVPTDASVPEAVRQQQPLQILFPSSGAASSIRLLARKIDDDFFAFRVKGGMQFFFEQIISGGIAAHG